MKLTAPLLLLGLLATPAAALDDYNRFLVPASDAEILHSATYADCMAASGGVTATLQDCMDAEYERLEPALASAYSAALASTDDRAALQKDQAEWLQTRWQHCGAESADGGGGSASDLIYRSCVLQEVARRILWLQDIRG